MVKAFSQEEPEIESFAVVNRDYLQKAIDLAKVNGLVWPAKQFLLGGAVLAILWVGARTPSREGSRSVSSSSSSPICRSSPGR